MNCHTTKGCDDSYKEERQSIKNELSMRDKALADTNFPDQKLINEFLITQDFTSKLNLKWTQPDFREFVVSTYFLKFSFSNFFVYSPPKISSTDCVRQ